LPGFLRAAHLAAGELEQGDGNLVSIERGVQRQNRFWAKNEWFSLVDMLDKSPHVDRFVDGDVFQSFLSGANYHRWHAPIDGVVRDARVVDGLLFSETESAGPEPSPGILCEGYDACVNTRGLIFIESPDPAIGMVCVVPIGMTEISSITIKVKVGDVLRKGDELGFFSYGGSSLALVFQKGSIDHFTVAPPPPLPVVDPTSGPAIQVNALIAIAR
jgi:phosphatidylserine decarboxylase